jgi:hypothetical protein
MTWCSTSFTSTCTGKSPTPLMNCSKTYQTTRSEEEEEDIGSHSAVCCMLPAHIGGSPKVNKVGQKCNYPQLTVSTCRCSTYRSNSRWTPLPSIQPLQIMRNVFAMHVLLIACMCLGPPTMKRLDPMHSSQLTPMLNPFATRQYQ